MSIQVRGRRGRATRDRGSSLFGQVARGRASGSAEVERLLGSLIGADFNITTDQSISITAGYRITSITVTNASVSMTTAVGGFYGAASKAAPVIVPASQVYSALVNSGVILNCTISSAYRGLSAVIFSLTTGQGAAATADIRVYGVSQ